MDAGPRPGLTARHEYVVPVHRTAPHLLPESDDFASLPPVLATGYLVGIVESACMRALDGHRDDSEQTLGVHVISRGTHRRAVINAERFRARLAAQPAQTE